MTEALMAVCRSSKSVFCYSCAQILSFCTQCLSCEKSVLKYVFFPNEISIPNFLFIKHSPVNIFVLKLLSAYYIFCIYLNVPETTFIMEANTEPRSGSGLMLVDSVCNVGYQSTSRHQLS